MWQTKYFKTFEQAQEWMKNHLHKYLMELVYTNQRNKKSSGYGVEYKPLIRLY